MHSLMEKIASEEAWKKIEEKKSLIDMICLVALHR